MCLRLCREKNAILIFTSRFSLFFLNSNTNHFKNNNNNKKDSGKRDRRDRDYLNSEIIMMVTEIKETLRSEKKRDKQKNIKKIIIMECLTFTNCLFIVAHIFDAGRR